MTMRLPTAYGCDRPDFAFDFFPLRLDSANWDQIERQLQKANATTVKQRDDEDKRLYCAHCGRPITDQNQRIPVQGGHEHTFTNPHGLVFRIGCFAAAPGCAQTGMLTEEWTWFRGYLWQVALCRGCGNHLGWRYRDYGGEGFYGLILPRLKSHKGSAA